MHVACLAQHLAHRKPSVNMEVTIFGDNTGLNSEAVNEHLLVRRSMWLDRHEASRAVRLQVNSVTRVLADITDSRVGVQEPVFLNNPDVY